MNTLHELRLESSLAGFCSLHKNLLYLSNVGVLVRNDEDFKRDSKSVMLISGGGAGHEPGHQGFIGQGMLSASVSGNVFTSPSVTRFERASVANNTQCNKTLLISSCLAAIFQAGDPSREVLMIINNYTGDRLNFGLAVEMARNVHNFQNVKLLIVDDDCSIENPRESTGRRGLAGCLLVSKIAGAMSAKGSSLNEIYSLCSDLLSQRLIRTIGFSFHHDITNQLTNIEIGYGIHGEPASIKIEKEKNFKPIIRVMTEKLRLNQVESEIVVLFNNLGGASEYIFYEFVNEFVEVVSESTIKIVKVYAGKFLTSLSKEAISVTVMELRDSKIMEYLTFPIDVPAGHLFNTSLELCKPNVKEFYIPKTGHEQESKSEVSSNDARVIRIMIEKACDAAVGWKQYLNDIDAELGDGDTGTTFSRGAEALLTALRDEKLSLDDPFEMLVKISSVLMDSMGGTSGAIFSIFFHSTSVAFAENNEHTIENWLKGILLGIDGIMLHGKSNLGDRTLLDSLHAGYLSAKTRSNKLTPRDMLKAFAEGCEFGAEQTRNMIPKSGRSSYSVGDKEPESEFTSKHPDPGAQAVHILADAIFKAFDESFSQISMTFRQ